MAKKEAKQEPKAGGKAGNKASSKVTETESFQVGSFLQGTKEELTKVVWPSRQQLISESAAVILMVSLSATLIYLVDKLFGFLSSQVF